METTMTAIEVTGTVDEHQQLLLDHALPIAGPGRVRVIVLYPLADEWDELVSFPFDDFSSSKVRPAVCLTEPIGPHNIENAPNRIGCTFI